MTISDGKNLYERAHGYTTARIPTNIDECEFFAGMVLYITRASGLPRFAYQNTFRRRH